MPAPELCPMPSKKKTKEMRSKIFSVYLRPWTLFPNGANLEVPFLGNLHLTQEQLRQNMGDANCNEICSMRCAWKEHTRSAPPHAFTQIRNFLMASMSEGRAGEEVEESSKRGEALRCKLSHTDVEKALELHVPKDLTSPAQKHPNDPTSTAQKHAAVGKRVWQSANLALELAALTRIQRSRVLAAHSNITRCGVAPNSAVSQDTTTSTHKSMTAAATMDTFDWTARYSC